MKLLSDCLFGFQLLLKKSRKINNKNRIEQLERDKRRSSLVINWVEEKEDEDVSEIIERKFEDVGVDFKTHVCINIYHRGR